MLRIKELRLEMGLTQKELGEKIESTSKNIWAYENEFSVPPLDVLTRLATFFKCSIDYLAGLTDEYGGYPISQNTGEILSNEERALLANYRKLDRFDKMRVEAYVQVRLENQTADEPNRHA